VLGFQYCGDSGFLDWGDSDFHYSGDSDFQYSDDSDFQVWVQVLKDGRVQRSLDHTQQYSQYN
jgi:hypothetical protein